MSTSEITFDAIALGGELDLTVMLDSRVIFQAPIGQQTQQVRAVLDDNQAGDHVMMITLSGKRPEHTRINDLREVLSDRLLQISNIGLDDLDIQQAFLSCSLYRHSHNGTTDTVTQPFYGTMGCNGTVTTRLCTPVYPWFLASMSKSQPKKGCELPRTPKSQIA